VRELAEGRAASTETVDRAAALVLDDAFYEGARRAGRIGELARAVRVRLRERAPTGTHWARSSACGPAEIEDVPDEDRGIYGCGMGHVPERAERFLYFFAVKQGKR
jgi:hypothetical protein